MSKTLPRQVDVVIVGNGPSALITAYILHGHVPRYDLSNPHHDTLLHEKLKSSDDLLNVDVDYLTEHFNASRHSYSTQALPVNVLLDTLIRPLGETDDSENKTCVRWEYDPSRKVPHIVVGDSSSTGGQWGNNPVEASWEIGTLSYAGMLSLPGYSFAEFHEEKYGQKLPFYVRPSRRDVADYFAIYPSKVGIEDVIYPNTTLSGISRQGSGFYIASHDICCKFIVLASGTFSRLIPPRPLLQPLCSLSRPLSQEDQDPLLVIGSGFSAADVIISTPPSRKIIHIYKWAPSKSPSPLRACHQNAYPEYAGVYRKMKMAAIQATKVQKNGRPRARRASSSAFDLSRDWNEQYEGLPNTEVIDVNLDQGNRSATITLKNSEGDTFTRRVGGLAYVIGRRGSLSYLDSKLQAEVCPTYDATKGVSGRDMREPANEDLEVAPNVFITGSLTGDTLIRFAYGGCVYAAGQIIARSETTYDARDKHGWKCSCAHLMSSPSPSKSTTASRSGRSSGSGSPTGGYVKNMTGLDGHHVNLHKTHKTRTLSSDDLDISRNSF